MDSQELYDKLKEQFRTKLHFLQDKPEETIDSTLKACWQYASGNPMSAVEAIKHPLPSLNEKQQVVLYELLEQRVRNIPLAHLTARQNFLGIEFLSDNRALIPRKETELLGKKALDLSYILGKDKEELLVMDICCGSGNLGLAVANFNTGVRLFASDLSEDAIGLTRDNMQLLQLQDRVHAEKGDLFSAFENDDYYEFFDMIICNPPYISTAKISKMDEEIARHEPTLAFDGGMFGFKIIQMLVEKAPVYLRKNGWLVFEVGLGQGEFIKRLCEGANMYVKIETVADDLNNIRVIAVQRL